jgi:dihydroneopterin aldolase
MQGTENNTRNTFFINDYDRIFTVRLAWHISQPFVCGNLTEVVKYALTAKNGIEYFAEIETGKVKKLPKKLLKNMLSHSEENQKLSIELFKRY